MRRIKTSSYSILLHALLVALALSTVLLARQNRALERRLTPEIPEPALAAGDLVEPFTAQSLAGGDVLVGASGGDSRDRLLLFFTTTCGACRQNQEKWRYLHERVGDRYAVLGVSLDPPEDTRRYSETLDLPFDVVSIPDPKEFAERYKVDLVPLTVHLGADGRVRGSWVGVLSDHALESI